MTRQDEHPASIGHGETDRIDKSIRNVSYVNISKVTRLRIDERLSNLKRELESHFKVTLNGHEKPQYLIYRSGCFYTPHRDVYVEDCVSAEVPQRLISIVIFLNNESETEFDGHYIGGRLTFYGLMRESPWDKCGLPMTGEEGLLVAFRSDIIHEVTSVIHGVRYTIVTWYY